MLNRKGDGRNIENKLPLKLRDIALVVDSLVEPSTKLRRNRLDRDALIGNRRKNNQQLGRALGTIGLVH